MSRRFMRRLAFLGVFAVLLAALAPTVSYAVAASQGETVVEMCTSFGLQKVSLPQGGDDQSSGTAASLHCPFCLAAHAALPSLAALPLAGPGVLGDAAPVALPGRVVHDLDLSWFALRSHAPPILS